VPPLAVYTHADLTAMMALQQQHQRAQQEEDEQTARALKRPRLVWTPELHKLFEAAVAKIGVNKAVPKTIMQVRACVCRPGGGGTCVGSVEYRGGVGARRRGHAGTAPRWCAASRRTTQG
jgi:hypothetical protein